MLPPILIHCSARMADPLACHSALQQPLELRDKRDHATRGEAGFVQSTLFPQIEDRLLMCIGPPPPAAAAGTSRRRQTHVQIGLLDTDLDANCDAVPTAPFDLLSYPVRRHIQRL